jgi:hypothetical protein
MSIRIRDKKKLTTKRRATKATVRTIVVSRMYWPMVVMVKVSVPKVEAVIIVL